MFHSWSCFALWFLGVGGYGYLLQPLWWVGMITSMQHFLFSLLFYPLLHPFPDFFFFCWFCFFVVVIVGEIANFVAYIYASAVLWALLLGKYLFPFYTILNTIVVSISCFSPYTVSLWWFCTATKSSILVRGTKILSGMHVQGLKLVIFSYKN